MTNQNTPLSQIQEALEKISQTHLQYPGIWGGPDKPRTDIKELAEPALSTLSLYTPLIEGVLAHYHVVSEKYQHWQSLTIPTSQLEVAYDEFLTEAMGMEARYKKLEASGYPTSKGGANELL